jgi:hypothetical protein
VVQLEARSELRRLLLEAESNNDREEEEDVEEKVPLEQQKQRLSQLLSIPEEVTVASIFLRCLRTGLWSEAGQLSEVLCRRMETSEHFNRDIHRVLKERL